MFFTLKKLWTALLEGKLQNLAFVQGEGGRKNSSLNFPLNPMTLRPLLVRQIDGKQRLNTVYMVFSSCNIEIIDESSLFARTPISMSTLYTPLLISEEVQQTAFFLNSSSLATL